MDISSLPEDCLVQIFSRTSPVDVIRSSVLSKQFFSVSESDTVWDNFLPSDFNDIISQSCSSLPHFASKKHLFFYLCNNPIFLRNNTQSFGLEKRGGKKCYSLGAKALQIAWGYGDTPWYWSFETMLESRFPEVAELKQVYWLEIRGRIHVKQLSPHTTYATFFIFKMIETNYTGFESTPVRTTVLEVDEDDEGPPRNNNHALTVKSFYLQPTSQRAHLERIKEKPGELPIDRGDGWMEVEMGRYRVGDIDSVSQRAVVEMTLWEVDVGSRKRSLVKALIFVLLIS